MTRATAIWNQESIVELLTRELARTAREGGDLTILLAGIDPPKSESREALPDVLLSEVAKRFSGLLRPYDHVGRFGAQQLLVVISGRHVNDVLPVAEELRRAVAEAPLTSSFPLTVSIAVADGKLRTEEELLKEASGLLYRAQVQGGNRVQSAKQLKGHTPRPLPRRKGKLLWVIVGSLTIGLAVLFVVAPSSFCMPFMLRDALNAGEIPPPLPADCAPTNERPSDGIMQALENQRQTRGLVLEGTVTCKIASAGPKDRSAQIDQQWLDSIYVNGTMQYKRHVLLAAHENVKGGTIFVLEQCLIPLWTYVTQPQDRCWESAEFWK